MIKDLNRIHYSNILMWCLLIVFNILLIVLFKDNWGSVVRGVFLGFAIATIVWTSVHNKMFNDRMRMHNYILNKIQEEINKEKYLH